MVGKMNVTYPEPINSKSCALRKFLSEFLFWSTALILILIAGLRPVGLDRDSTAYATFIQSVTEVNFLDKEPAFWLIKWFNDVLFHGNIHTFFLIFAVLGVSLKFLAIKRLSKLPWLSVIVYLSMYFILHEMTQIRVGVAAGIFLLAIPDIYNRNFKKFITKALLASLFHYSAIIMVPLYFLNPRKISIIYLLLPITGLLFAYFNLSKMLLTNFVGILPEFLAYKIRMYLSLLELGEHSKINILNFYYSSLLILLYFCLFCYITNKIKFTYDILFIKILSIMLFTFYFFSPLPVFAFRISEFFGVISIILLPNLVLYFKQKEILLLLIISYFVYYFFFKTIGLLNLNM
jgi:hypothetical protein